MEEYGYIEIITQKVRRLPPHNAIRKTHKQMLPNAYLKLVSVILEDEVKIVEEMNSVGNSSKDNLRYDELKLEREDLYKECVPLLEELIKVSPENIDALNTLKNIYGVLGNNEGFMQLKAKIEELQAN